MSNRKQNHQRFISEQGGVTAAFSEQRATAIEIIVELEAVHGVDDDLIQIITEQGERIERAIIQLLRGGIRLG